MTMPDGQIDRPDVVVPDTGPLIHLAQADALHLLHEIGGRVVVADMVVLEATQDLSRPGAARIREWIDAGTAEGSHGPGHRRLCKRCRRTSQIGSARFRYRFPPRQRQRALRISRDAGFAHA
ncbi:hypothetical protein [Sphingomonas sp. VNH70]|uniref:hypothetical protein n=1 Tax=Sphingomonas silueang TaxID=3156617 RepID=UPI0032B3580A